MKRALPYFAMILAVVVCLTACSGCAGTKARTHVLFPLVQKSWTGVLECINKAVAADQKLQTPAVEVAISAMEDYVKGDDYATVLSVPWALLKDLPDKGVDAMVASKEISAGVAISLKERNRKFAESMEVLAGNGQPK